MAIKGRIWYFGRSSIIIITLYAKLLAIFRLQIRVKATLGPFLKLNSPPSKSQSEKFYWLNYAFEFQFSGQSQKRKFILTESWPDMTFKIIETAETQ